MNTLYLVMSLIMSVMLAYNAFHVTFSGLMFIFPTVLSFVCAVSLFYLAINYPLTSNIES